MSASSDFQSWFAGVPFIIVEGDPDFNTWLGAVPLVDIGEVIPEPEPPAPVFYPTWPSLVPLPLVNPQMAGEFGGQSTLMESGRKRIRRILTAPTERLEVNWNFAGDQYILFKAFFDGTLANGSSPFHIEIFGESKLMAFLESDYSFDHSDNLFTVTASLEYIDSS